MEEAEAPDPDGNDYTEVDAGDITREPEEDVISGEPDAPANDAGDGVDLKEVTGGFSVVSEEDVIEKEDDAIEEEMVEDVDPIIGGKRSDELLGSERNDKILGKKGNDTLDGGLGDDVLDGGKGDDILTGGEGADTFKVSKGDDVITDFVFGLDTFKGRLKKAEVTVLDTGDSLIEHKRGSILLEGLELTANELLI
jgi:Ca2+-binding RTX toxin-like protein